METIPHLRTRNPVPDIERINGKWVMPGFKPSTSAWNYEEFMDKTGTIYAIECAGYIKIGMAKNFNARFAGLDVACPLPMKKLATRTVPRSAMLYAETWMHQQFDSHRIKGEWFDASQEDILAALPKAVRRAEIYDRECRIYYEQRLEEAAERRVVFDAWLEKQADKIKEANFVEQIQLFDKTPEARAIR